jgi:hypothetical protein
LYLYDFIVGVDLLGRLLSFDHRARPTAAEALGKLFQHKNLYRLFVHMKLVL